MFASAQNKNINTKKLDIASRLLQGQPQARENYWSQLNLDWLGLAWIGLDTWAGNWTLGRGIRHLDTWTFVRGIGHLDTWTGIGHLDTWTLGHIGFS